MASSIRAGMPGLVLFMPSMHTRADISPVFRRTATSAGLLIRRIPAMIGSRSAISIDGYRSFSRSISISSRRRCRSNGSSARLLLERHDPALGGEDELVGLVEHVQRPDRFEAPFERLGREHLIDRHSRADQRDAVLVERPARHVAYAVGGTKSVVFPTPRRSADSTARSRCRRRSRISCFAGTSDGPSASEAPPAAAPTPPSRSRRRWSVGGVRTPQP